MFNLNPYKKNNITLEKKEDVFEHFFDNFFDDFLQPLNDKIDNTFNTFKVDVIEEEDHYIILSDLPGFEKENVSIEYENNYLTIIAKTDLEKTIETSKFIRRERKVGDFKRSFFIENVLLDDMNASFINGVLKIKLGKSKKNESKKIIIIE